MGIGRHAHSGAGGPVEHRGWNLKPAVRIGTAQITAISNAVRLLDSCVNADPKTKPWMPWVQQFPKLGSVGVLKSCCTTWSGHTARSATSRQRRTPGSALPTCNGTGRWRYVGAPPRPVALPSQRGSNDTRTLLIGG